MRHLLSYSVAGLALVLVLVFAPLAEAQKKPAGDKDKDKDGEKNTEKHIKAGVVTGKVDAVYEEKKTLRLTVSYQVPKLDTGAVNGLAQAQAQYQQAMLRRDVNGMQQAALQMAQNRARMYTVETKSQPLEVGTIDEVVVRAGRPPESFDDKGKIKRLSKAELKEAKGDPKLPGYKAEFGDIQVGSLVQVSLVKKKEAAKPAPKPKKGKDAEGDLLGDNQPVASQIVILADPPKGP